jgi:hypothetical protein
MVEISLKVNCRDGLESVVLASVWRDLWTPVKISTKIIEAPSKIRAERIKVHHVR